MPNRLRSESSPYLQQHADNPVEWWPWSDEALAFARAHDRPIFLSIGYAACHWCHVMAHESFEDPATAWLLNQDFVPIKVDREERPDLDAIYMQAVVAMTGQGGWPLSAFLTPAGEPFFAGTYFPPEPRHNLPAFRQVLQAMAQAWRSDRSRLQATAQRVLEHLTQAPAGGEADAGLDTDLLSTASRGLFETYDWTHGGWGGAPKFPQASAIELLLRLHVRNHDRLPLDMAVDCLQRMAHGGLYDQLGGGFHRYSVDAAWQVPHFEKMLYDNALLARAYLHAWQLTGDEELLQVSRSTLDYLLREMADSVGGFYSSEDADSEGEEGRFYLWAIPEIRQLLEPSGLSDFAQAAYGTTEGGNFEGRNILHLPLAPTRLADRLGLGLTEFGVMLKQVNGVLFQARQHRRRPGRDEKVLTDWNGLLLATLADAARALQDSTYLAAAQKLAGFLLFSWEQRGRLHHAWRDGRPKVPAFLKDFAALGSGLLTLYQADFDNRWYSAALDCAEQILRTFEDPAGGFYDVPADEHGLLFRPMELQDSPSPSGGALAASLLLQLATLADDQRLERAAERAIARMQPLGRQHPGAFAAWLAALDYACGPRWQLALLGRTGFPDLQALMATAAAGFHPRLLTAGAPQYRPEGPALLLNRGPINGQAAAYLCQDYHCDLPTTDPAELRAQLQKV
ncbi:MAG: thioredoxin domain-containing protein [Anaerolineales bacterium]|nr:thioredoxin domain-containing protein [Anaerolineales bacterium]